MKNSFGEEIDPRRSNSKKISRKRKKKKKKKSRVTLAVIIRYQMMYQKCVCEGEEYELLMLNSVGYVGDVEKPKSSE
jgi:hypothetical protein